MMHLGPVYSPIGLDIDGRWIRAAQLRRVGQAWRLHAAMQIIREHPDEPLTNNDAAMVAGALERQGFATTPLVISAPRESCVTAVLELPPRSSGAPIRQIAKAELARVTRLDAATMECELWDVPGSSRGETTPAMVVALPHASGAHLAGIFTRIADVASIDARLCALSRAAKTWLPAAGLGAIVDVGWHSSSITVIAGTTPIFERSLDSASLARLYAEIAGKIGPHAVDSLMETASWQNPDFLPLHQVARPCITSFLDSLSNELQRSLAYIATRTQNTPLSAILLSGPDVPGIGERMEKALGQSVRALMPADAVEIEEPCAHFAARRELLVAIGLAVPVRAAEQSDGRRAA